MPFAVPPVITIRKPLSCERVKVNWEHPLNRGLLNWWMLNEGIGLYARSLCPSGSVGVLTGGPVWTQTSYGQALYFDGSNDYISIPGGGGLNNLQTGSISAWVQWQGLQDPGWGGSQFGAVTSRQKSGTFSEHIIGLGTNDPVSAKVVWAPYTSGYILIGNTAVGDGRWRHIAVTYASGDHRLYVDGASDASPASNTGTISNDATIPFGIGAWYEDGSGYFKGLILDVSVYNRILDAHEIMNLFKTPYGTPDNPRLI